MDIKPLRHPDRRRAWLRATLHSILTASQSWSSDVHILMIEGMSCEACKRAISSAINLAAPGTAFEVDLERKQVRFNDLPPDRFSLVRNAIREAGYGIIETGR
ncbi:MAG: heavy metal-associated domain-containing protein [Ferrovibrio sp.]